MGKGQDSDSFKAQSPKIQSRVSGRERGVNKKEKKKKQEDASDAYKRQRSPHRYKEAKFLYFKHC